MSPTMRALPTLRHAATAAALALCLDAGFREGAAQAQPLLAPPSGEPWEMLPPVFGDTVASCIDLGDDAICFGLTCREGTIATWFLGTGDWSDALVVEAIRGQYETPEARVYHIPLDPDEEATADAGFPVMTAPAGEQLVSDIVESRALRVAPLSDGQGAWMLFSTSGAAAVIAALERRCAPGER